SFNPHNLVVAVVGNFDPETVKSELSSLALPCENCKPDKLPIPAVQPLLKSKVVTEQRPQLSATWIAQGWLAPAIKDRKDFMALKILNSLLGTGMSSRLFVDLREKQGLAYAVGSTYPSKEQTSRFIAYIGTDPVNGEKVKTGFAQEIKRLQQELVPEKELQ